MTQAARAATQLPVASPPTRRRGGHGWIVKRLGISALTIVLASMLVFAGARALPGDPALALAGQGSGSVTPAVLAKARAQYGLDAPVPVQYLRYVGNALHGDLGISSHSALPVGQMLVQRLPVTLELALLALAFAVALGTAAGTFAALARGRAGDYAVNALGLLGISVPSFWLGLMLIVVFSLQLGWFPTSGFTPIAQDPLENLRGMVLPTAMLGTALAAVLMRQMRSTMIDALASDYVRTARAKGLRRGRVVLGHALRNSLIPLLTMTGLQLGALISGAVVTEQLFVLPGLGQLLLDGLQTRDYAVIQAVALVMAVSYVVINLLVDLLYGAVDPRVRLAGRAE